jgi:YD repeat-containing protein
LRHQDNVREPAPAHHLGKRYDVNFVKFQPLGSPLSVTPVGRPASEVISYVYDDGTLAPYQKRRLSRIVGASGTTTLAYDHRGNMVGETRPSSISVTTVYDGHGRLTSYTRTAAQSNVYNGLDGGIGVLMHSQQVTYFV